MFGKGKAKGQAGVRLESRPERFDTLVGPQARVEGRLIVRESIRIDGTVVGDIEAPADQPATVVVAATGEVRGNITARRIVVTGKVAGHLHGPGSVELLEGCLVEGDIKYGSISIEHGAQVLGLLLKIDPAGEGALSGPDARALLQRAQAG